jgi:hypothetical protein
MSEEGFEIAGNFNYDISESKNSGESEAIAAI